MVQVDLPAAFALGQIYGLLSKDYLKKEPNKFLNRLSGPLNLFMSCGLAPVGMFLMIGWPAWEVMYVSGWVENPYNKPAVSAFYVLFGVFMVLLGNAGFILAHHWYRKGKDSWVVFGSIAGLFLTVLPFLVKWGIWWKVGTYAESQSGSGYSFFSAPFIIGWVIFMGYFFVVATLTGIWFKRKGNKIEP